MRIFHLMICLRFGHPSSPTVSGPSVHSKSCFENSDSTERLEFYGISQGIFEIDRMDLEILEQDIPRKIHLSP